MVDFRNGIGQSFDFYKKLTVTNTIFGDPNDGYRQDTFIPFSTYGVSFLNETPSVPVQISFDGYNIHDELSTGIGLTNITYENRVICKIWLKVASSTATVSIRAWGIR